MSRLPAIDLAFVLFTAVVSAHGTEDKVLRQEANRLFGVLAALAGDDAPAPAQAELGRALFWDARVSANGKTSCASCHLPEDWGADRRRFSPDARGKETARNSQTVFNSMLQPALRWTGDRKSGAHQAERSLTGSMGFSKAEDVLPVLKSLGYKEAFHAAFPNDPEALSPGNYGRALEAYQSLLITPSAFDRYLLGDDEALRPQQKEGLRLFVELGCADCHRGPLLGGRLIRKFGVKKDYWPATRSDKVDAGLFETSKLEADKYRFRAPMLRNIEKTGPFFHDGAVANLSEAVQVMADVQLGNRLPESQAAAITAFLKSLTGEIPEAFRPPAPKAAAQP